jgi:hypothetical protein
MRRRMAQGHGRALADQRIADRQGRKAIKIPIGGPEFPHSMLQAYCSNTSVVNATAGDMAGGHDRDQSRGSS